MKTKQILALICVATIALTDGKYLGKNKNGIKMYSIDLDLPAEQRFVDIGKDFKEPANYVINQYLELIPWPVQLIMKEVAGMFWWVQPEYYQELIGMSPGLGIDPKMILLSQYAYEFSAFCTSVLAYDSNGTIIHGRNLDFAFAPAMRNITYEAVFQRDG
jgi:N-acylethanolamine-hydrolysing acid amidase